MTYPLWSEYNLELAARLFLSLLPILVYAEVDPNNDEVVPLIMDLIHTLQQVSQSSWEASCILRVTLYMKLLPMTHIQTTKDSKKVMQDIA